MILNLKNEDGRVKISTIKYRLYFALLSSIDVDNFPKAVGATISSNVLLPGKTHHILDAKINTVNPTGAAGQSQGTLALTLSPQIEGFSKNVLDFIYKINGERIIVIWEDCTTRNLFIAGSPCSGGLLVSITSLGKMEDGFYGAVLQMQGGECPEPFYFYEGPILLDTPEAVAADSTAFPLAEKYQYQLADNTASTTLTDITGITDDDVGRIFEVIGAGVNFPTLINPTVKFILRNGVQWVGTLGSKITFQIVKTGASQYAFFEIQRS
jgi:hypothetical protein